MTEDNARLELVSFDICPYVQRSVITLREKGVRFQATYIDLAHPPDWFLSISPFGKVPVLRVGDTVLFESAVINEYLDEVWTPRMHPPDPLERARHRAWIEFGSGLLAAAYEVMVAPDRQRFEERADALRALLGRAEGQPRGPFFAGDAFSLVDVAYAPLFQRLDLLEGRHQEGWLDRCPNLRAWSAALRARPSVAGSLPEGFEERFLGYIRARHGYLAETATA